MSYLGALLSRLGATLAPAPLVRAADGLPAHGGVEPGAVAAPQVAERASGARPTVAAAPTRPEASFPPLRRAADGPQAASPPAPSRAEGAPPQPFAGDAGDAGRTTRDARATHAAAPEPPDRVEMVREREIVRERAPAPAPAGPPTVIRHTTHVVQPPVREAAPAPAAHVRPVERAVAPAAPTSPRAAAPTPALRVAPAAPAQGGPGGPAPAPPPVSVTIGRIVVRADSPRQRREPKQAAPPSTHRGLGDYLKERGGGER